MHAVIYELGLIVVVNDRDTLRQRLVDLCYFLFDSLDHLLGVFVDPLENDSGNDFSLTILSYCTLADLVTDLQSSNVADSNWSAFARVEDDVSDIRDVFDQTETANDVLFVTMFDEVGARVLIIVLDGFKERLERDVVTNQRLLIDDDLILLDVAAKAEHVGDARHSAQLQLYDPILDRPQFLVALSVADDLIKIDLTRPGGDWSHLRFEAGRDTIFRRGQAFEDLLACEIDVGVVSEIDGDYGQPKLGF